MLEDIWTVNELGEVSWRWICGNQLGSEWSRRNMRRDEICGEWVVRREQDQRVRMDTGNGRVRVRLMWPCGRKELSSI